MKLWDSAVLNDRIMHCAGGMLSRMDMAALHGVFARGRLRGKDKEAGQKTWIKMTLPRHRFRSAASATGYQLEAVLFSGQCASKFNGNEELETRS